jgi:glycosyltransferase involved in cell wall biosynthesis
MSTPLVSICIPTHRPEYLGRAVRSCLAQTCQDFEIFITDNNPSGESGRIVAKLNDPRIHYQNNNENIGGFRNYVKVVDQARGHGKYIYILADDDLIKPRFFETMITAFEKNPSVGIVMAPMDLIDENDQRIFPRFYLVHKMQYRYRYQVGDGLIGRKRVLWDFLTGAAGDYPCCVPTGMLYRAEAFWPALPFDIKADFAGDLDLCMKIATTWDFYYIDEVLSSWRYTPTNHTATLHKAGLPIEAFYYVTRRCLANPAVQEMFGSKWDRLVQESLLFCSWRSAVLNGLAAVRARNPKQVQETLKTVLKEDPYRTNLLRFPVCAGKQAVRSFFPPKLPPARE